MRTVKLIRYAVLITAVMTVAVASAQEELRRETTVHRPAWELTVGERLAGRFDAARIAERNREYRLAHPDTAASKMTTHGAEGPERAVEYVIDGRRNPELFLPHELFASLLTGVTSPEPLRTLQRGYYRDAIREFGFDTEVFWSELERASSRLASTMEQSDASGDERCRDRHQALQTARAVFGRERFERFLYIVVAPSKQYAVTTTVKDPAAALQRAEMGCR